MLNSTQDQVEVSVSAQMAKQRLVYVDMRSQKHFFVRWMGGWLSGWVVGLSEFKAILAILVEVVAELGKNNFSS